MCGFAGVLSSWSMSPESLEAGVERMVRQISHRGPDQQGLWCSPQGQIGLGFRRLSIVDLSIEGSQPMRSESGRFVIAFNGEVYNFLDLRQSLEGIGHRFRGTSDTEVILASFEEWGVDEALRRFNGMFAIALWDTQTSTLFLVRDRIGIKPLYVYRQPGFISFGSELKALVAGPSFDKTLDRRGFGLYLRYGYVPAPFTIYQHAIKLLPGCYLAIRSADVDLPAPTPYWSLDEVRAQAALSPTLAGDEAVEQLDHLLRDAVKMQMVSDVPLGALLSGGVDSSLVVSLMREVSQASLKTFTIGFDTADYDESDEARRVAEHFGTDHTELRVSGTDALEVVPLLSTMFDEPHADPSQIPTYLVSRLARSRVTVALSGDGGDELFAGYNRYRLGERAMATVGSLPPGARRGARAALRTLSPVAWARLYGYLGRYLPGLPEQGLLSSKIAKLDRLLSESTEAEMYLALMSSDGTGLSTHSALGENLDVYDRAFSVIGSSEPSGLIERMMLADQTTYLPDDLLAKVDRASMATSLEVRVPLLDHRVIEMSWRMARSAKLRGHVTKWALRQVLYRRIPRELIERPKKGFTVPLDAWLRGPLRDWAEDLLSASRLSQTGLISPAQVRSVWHGVMQGTAPALAIWPILVFQDWASRWMPSAPDA